VREALIAQGLETPLVPNRLSREERHEAIAKSFAHIMRALGLDLADARTREEFLA